MLNTTRSKIMASLYVSLFVLSGGSLFIFLHSFITLNAMEWNIYARSYFMLMIAYTWYTFILLFLGDFQESKYPAYDNETIAVIVPCYNEKPELFKRSLKSVIRAKGNKKILVVDDGSSEEIGKEIKTIIQNLRQSGIKIDLHVFENNRGKRHALHHAITKLVGDSQFVVTIDSDTILDKDALIRIVEPLKDSSIGASSGDVRLLNENQNWLTRMIGTYYWVGLNIFKKAQSSQKMVICCSGCLSAYKTPIIMSIIDEFADQEFLGEKCTHSEDRHLTNLILRGGYGVVYVPDAISYTETPATIKGFLKQQQRWKRGYIRESVYTLTFAWKNNKLLFLQTLLYDLTTPFMTLGLNLATLFVLFKYPYFFLIYILPSWIAFMILRNIPVFFYAKDKIRGLFTYALFYEVFLYWMAIYALFTVKNKSWITR